MNARNYYQSNLKDRQKILDMCEKAKTSVSNFRQIALYDGAVSKDLAERLAEASDGEMTASEIMFPESK